MSKDTQLDGARHRGRSSASLLLWGLLLALCTAGLAAAQSPPAGASTSASAQATPAAPGVVLAHTEHRTISSSAIGQRYDLLVSLPEDYATSGRAYPVLYVLDGWHFPLLAFLQNNIVDSKRMPPVISVTISHGPTDARALRDRDFTPKPMANKRGSGGGAAFLAFLERELIPWVERTYRTVPTDRAILGHSLGGLFALYAVGQRPALFQRVVAASPAWLPDNAEVIASLESLRSGGAPVRLDISIGEEEPGVANVAAFAARLDQARLPNLTHRFTVYQGENHNSVRLASIPNGLYWLYRAGHP